MSDPSGSHQCSVYGSGDTAQHASDEISCAAGTCAAFSVVYYSYITGSPAKERRNRKGIQSAGDPDSFHRNLLYCESE